MSGKSGLKVLAAYFTSIR